MKSGEKPSSAMRVIGRVSPKMVTPIAPRIMPSAGEGIADFMQAPLGGNAAVVA
ncbi:hypothetical protein D3C72_2276620 [compost metagenome]